MRLMVAGSADMVANNIAFMLNLADWMVQDEALINIRSKVLRVNTFAFILNYNPFTASTIQNLLVAVSCCLGSSECDGCGDENEAFHEILIENQGFNGVVCGYVGVTIWDGVLKVSSSKSLPTIDSIMRTDIARIALTSMGNTVTLEQQNGEWVEELH